MKNVDGVLKTRVITLLTNIYIYKHTLLTNIYADKHQSYGFSSSHVWMWELGHKEGWAPKNWCFWTVVLEKTLESPLDCKEIQPVNPKGNQPWIFIGRTDAEAETPILWLPDVKIWLIGKDSNAGKNRRQEKGMTEDEMVRWHHWLNGHEFEQTLGDGEGQGSQVAAIHGVAKSRTQVSDWTITEQYYYMILLKFIY